MVVWVGECRNFVQHAQNTFPPYPQVQVCSDDITSSSMCALNGWTSSDMTHVPVSHPFAKGKHPTNNEWRKEWKLLSKITISIYIYISHFSCEALRVSRHSLQYIYIYRYIYIYIYTLGAGGSPKVLWVGYCEWFKIVISLWRNVSFWRSHSLHRIVFCAGDFFWSACWLIKNPSFIHLYLWETCDLCGKMTILEMLWCSKCSKVLWATVFLEVVS